MSEYWKLQLDETQIVKSTVDWTQYDHSCKLLLGRCRLDVRKKLSWGECSTGTGCLERLWNPWRFSSLHLDEVIAECVYYGQVVLLQGEVLLVTFRGPFHQHFCDAVNKNCLKLRKVRHTVLLIAANVGKRSRGEGIRWYQGRELAAVGMGPPGVAGCLSAFSKRLRWVIFE